jgi:hypothetical protein
MRLDERQSFAEQDPQAILRQRQDLGWSEPRALAQQREHRVRLRVADLVRCRFAVMPNLMSSMNVRRDSRLAYSRQDIR